MANQRLKILDALDKQEEIEGKSPDTDLIRKFLSCITTNSEWQPFVKVKFHSYGKHSYQSHKFYYPTDNLKKIMGAN